jgi:hypothetical protein
MVRARRDPHVDGLPMLTDTGDLLVTPGSPAALEAQAGRLSLDPPTRSVHPGLLSVPNVRSAHRAGGCPPAWRWGPRASANPARSSMPSRRRDAAPLSLAPRLSAAPAPARTPRGVEPVDDGVEAGCEPFVAVVEPDMFAENDQRGEAIDRQ